MDICLNKSIWNKILFYDSFKSSLSAQEVIGLKQTPCDWYENIDRFFVNVGFKHCEFDHIIYVLHVHDDTLIVELYVDDLDITGNNANLILVLKKQLADPFEMNNLGLLHFFLGIQILLMNDGVFIYKPKYTLYISK